MTAATAGMPFTAMLSTAPADIESTLTLEVYDPLTGATVLPPSSAGILEVRPGTYSTQRTVAQPGRYLIRWQWPDDAAEDELEVVAAATAAPSGVPVLLASVDELDKALGGRAGEESEWLEVLLAGASEALERETERLLRPLQRSTDPVGTEIVYTDTTFARIPDAREITEVRLDGRAIPLGLPGRGGYRLHRRRGHPAHAIVLPGHGSYYGGGGTLELVGRFGFDPVPADVHLAAITWAARVYYEHQARLADQTADPEGGAAAYFRQVPAGILATIKRYRIPGA